MPRLIPERPKSVPAYFTSQPTWLWPLLAVEWPFAWLAYALSRWSFLQVLSYLGRFSVLIAVIFYFSEAGNRLKQKHYQAWQVVNTAQGMGGSGGRIEALSELNADGVPLTGVNATGAFLQGIQLPKARLLRANLDAADLRDSNLAGADLSWASLAGANLRQANVATVNFDSADLTDADLCRSRIAGANLSNAVLDRADLGSADLSGIQWRAIRSVKQTNLAGVHNAPAGFREWALKNGAIELANNPSCPLETTAH